MDEQLLYCNQERRREQAQILSLLNTSKCLSKEVCQSTWHVERLTTQISQSRYPNVTANIAQFEGRQRDDTKYIIHLPVETTDTSSSVFSLTRQVTTELVYIEMRQSRCWVRLDQVQRADVTYP